MFVGAIEHRTLVRFLETALLYLAFDRNLFLEILVPRDLTQAHIETNVAGLTWRPAVWQWPDARMIVSKCRHLKTQADIIPVAKFAVMEEGLSEDEIDDYSDTLQFAPPVPPLPIYPTTHNPHSHVDWNREIHHPGLTRIVDRVRTLVAAGAPPPAPPAQPAPQPAHNQPHNLPSLTMVVR